jgi:hypothetical protein
LALVSLITPRVLALVSLITPRVLALVSLITPRVLALVSLASPRLVVITIAIILFRLIASVDFSFIPLVASLAPLMVTKIIITVSTVTAGVAVAVKPLLRRSDRAARDGRKNDESYCESCRSDQSGKT